MIHENIVLIATRDQETMDEIHAANTSVTLEEGRLNHLLHCIGYLRQNIMCRADTSLEWRSEANHKHIDGYGIPHQCRNWVSCPSPITRGT